MNRGDIWIVASTGGGGGFAQPQVADSGYASKPRPMLIIQSDRYGEDDSVVVCLVTSHEMTEADAVYRVALPKTPENGLKRDSFVMIDKVVAVPRHRLNQRIGKISQAMMEEVYRRLMDFLAE